MARHGDSAFCCPDDRINEDHRALFKLLDQIATQRRKTDREDLELLLKRLLEDTLHHFAHEESLMRASRYSGALDHQKQHRSISKTIREALGQVSQGQMLSPLDIERVKQAYTFHFKRDDLPLMTSPQMKSVRQELDPDQRRRSSGEFHGEVASRTGPGDRSHQGSQTPSLVSPGAT